MKTLMFYLFSALSALVLILSVFGGGIALIMALYGVIEYIKEAPDAIWWFEYAFYIFIASIISYPLSFLFIALTKSFK